MKKTLVDQSGEKIPRIGVAGVKRVLMKPVKISGAQTKADYAMVRCPEKDIYITRHGIGQRSCKFAVSWWPSKEDETQKTQEFDFKDREKAINKFLRLVKTLYE